MVSTIRRWGAAAGAGLCAIFSASCAGGESESAGGFNLPGVGTSQTSTSAGSGGSGGTDSTDTDEDTDPQSPTDPTMDPTAVSATDTASSGPDTTGPVLTCTLAEDCDDADPCTEDNCVNSECSNEPVTCDDTIDCTMDSCDPLTGACVNTPSDAACDDGDLCTGTETCSAAMGCLPGQTVTCSDGLSCTMDSCNPATGMCSFDDIEACSSGDGCCPIGCSVADTDCTCTNLALSATPSSSGGGSNAAGYGPNNWVDGNDEASCNGSCTQCFGWVENSPTPSGAWMQLEWGTPQIIGSMYIDGIAAGGCTSTSRALAGGTVQAWNGATWVDVQTFSGGSGDLEFSFDPPLQTSRLRIYDVVAPPGGINSLAFEWYAFEPLGCTP